MVKGLFEGRQPTWKSRKRKRVFLQCLVLRRRSSASSLHVAHRLERLTTEVDWLTMLGLEQGLHCVVRLSVQPRLPPTQAGTSCVVHPNIFGDPQARPRRFLTHAHLNSQGRCKAWVPDPCAEVLSMQDTRLFQRCMHGLQVIDEQSPRLGRVTESWSCTPPCCLCGWLALLRRS